MEVKYRTAMALVQIQDHLHRSCKCFEEIREKKPEPAARVSETLLVRHPSFCSGTLARGQTRHEYLTGEPVFSQGEPANAVFYIQSGEVQLTAGSEEGEQAVSSALHAGSFVGESCLADQSLRCTSATAITRSVLVRIEKHLMMAMFRSDPSFAIRFLTSMVSRGNCMEEELSSQYLDSGEAWGGRMRLIEL